MNAARSLWASIPGDPRSMQRLHGWATVLWLAAAAPIMVWLAESVAFIVFISVYAVVTGHWSSWQASRVEVRQDEHRTAGRGTSRLGSRNPAEVGNGMWG